MRGAPTEAIPKAWRRLVLDADGKVGDPKAYVFAIIDAWRAAIKRRDVFAQPGIRYGDPRRGMLEGAAWQESQIAGLSNLGSIFGPRHLRLRGSPTFCDQTFRKVAARAADNPDLRFETNDEKTRDRRQPA